jgi:tRNA/rRNA methyltransferase
MKTMGLSRLFLVAPRRFPDPQAEAMASGATDVVKAATVCTTLESALADTALALAVTSRRREWPHPVLTPRTCAPALLAEAVRAPVALVFGNETFGLSNEEAAKCRYLVNIPANPDYPSLNLGAAVQVLCYELRTAVEDAPLHMTGAGEPARFQEQERFYTELQETLVRIGFLDPAVPKRLMPRLRRLFARAGLEREEAQILLGILRQVNKIVDQNTG